jgi:hypothetical protein
MIPQQSLLQDVAGKEPVYIRSIIAYCSSNLTGVKGLPGTAIAAPGDINNGLLTLIAEGAKMTLREMPLALMNPFVPNAASYAAGRQDVTLFADLFTVDWTQSYINTIIAAPTVTAFAYVLGIGYLYESDIERMIKNNIDWADV